MKVNHTIYGIILFLILIGLIYILNKNKTNNNNNITEYFDSTPTPTPTKKLKNIPTPTPPYDLNNDYMIYEKSYFDLSGNNLNSKNDKTIKQCLISCANDKNCKGITIDSSSKVDSDVLNSKNYECYAIKDAKTCYSKLQGSGLQRSESQNYTTYLKKSVPSSGQLCLSDTNLGQPIMIKANHNLYLYIDNNKLYTTTQNKIEFDKLYDKAKFKIVNGLYGDETISIQPYNSNDLFLSHNFPREKGITLKRISRDDTDDMKKNSSFRIVSGLSNKGYSIKILNFPNMYFKLNNDNKEINEVSVDAIENKSNTTLNELSTFYIVKELDVVIDENLSKFDVDYSEINQEEEDTTSSLTQEDKYKLMKNKNLNTLDRQYLMLDNQYKKINDLEFLHTSNISKIGREFANQSARLALGKYIKEKDEIDLLKETTTVTPGFNMPSVDNIRAQTQSLTQS